MTLEEIFGKYMILLNLQRHMLRVAGVGKVICDNASSIEIDSELVVKVLLLHDMGNILKVDFSRSDMFEDEDIKRLDEYKRTKEEFATKYGTNPEEATLQIIEEITSDRKIRALCEAGHWENTRKYVKKGSPEERVVLYSDMRVGPFGVISLKERFDDLKKRRPKETEFFNRVLGDAEALENEIDKTTKIDVRNIDDQMVDGVAGELRQVEI